MNLSDAAVLIKALESTGSPVTIADARLEDTPIVYCNDAFLKLSGYSLDEIIGKNCRFLQGDDTDRRQVAKLKTAIDAGEDTSVVLLNYTKDGRSFWNDLRISPMFNDDHQLTHFIGFQNDISARLEQERVDLLIEKIENDLERSKLEEERLTKLNTLQQDFIHTASERLQEPALTIQKQLESLLSAPAKTLSDKDAESIKKVLAENSRQLKAIDELLVALHSETKELTNPF